MKKLRGLNSSRSYYFPIEKPLSTLYKQVPLSTSEINSNETTILPNIFLKSKESIKGKCTIQEQKMTAHQLCIKKKREDVSFKLMIYSTEINDSFSNKRNLDDSANYITIKNYGFNCYDKSENNNIKIHINNKK